MRQMAWLLVVASAAGGVAMLGGCSSASVVRTELPVAWIRALPTAGQAADVAGAYRVIGTVLAGKPALRDRRPIDTIHDLFFEREQRRAVGDQIELRRPDGGHLQVIVHGGGGTIAVRTLEAVIERESGALLLRRTESEGGSNLPGGHFATNTIRLWKGRDGCLYARVTTYGAGLAIVLPYLDHGEAWGRWEPATPEGFARDAERQSRLAARRLLRVGERLPDFPLVTDGRGEKLRRADLEGRVVVLVFPGRDGQPAPILGRLREFQTRYQDRGFEVICVWTNPVSERAAVEAVIARHGLPGRHVFEPEDGPDATVLAGLYRLRPPWALVVDRSGRIAGTTPRAAADETLLGRLLQTTSGSGP